VRLLQAIDVGTNSVRSIVVEVPEADAHRIIDDEKEMTRLGRGLAATGRLDAEAVERTVSALKAMTDIGRNLGVDDVHAIATEAVRRASNGAEFIQRLRDEVGLEVKLVSPREEGRLVWLSAASLTKEMPASVVVDIGGGSVEVVQGAGAQPVAIASLPIGARIATEQYLAEDPPSDASFKKLKRAVRRALREGVTPLEPGIQTIVGSGGAITTIASLVAGMRGRRYESLQGVQMERAEIMQLLGALSHSSAEQRLAMPGMSADRVDIILAGTLVLAEVMKLFGASCVLVNARGIREGIVLDALAQSGTAEPALDHMSAVRGVGERYRFDRQHAEQVTRLALSIFDQLAAPMHLDVTKRRLLESAAMLHDIGYYIAYDRHHRHSHHLILHSGLPGFTRRELAMVAAIARYHTKALPKKSHESWSALEPADRATVRELASILRIADGLDRGRGAHVESVAAHDDGSTVRLEVAGAVDLHAERYGVGKKKDLFEETFGRHVEVDVVGGTRSS
jgi:exopolyphosphatase / guanosine-5'-triphosphate,3'-diphosphate pyrophosphatase